jgi:hypothetical protein
VGRVLLAHQPAGQQREPGLHEEHQVAGVQRPAKVRGHAHVADGVGELHRERLLRRLFRVVGVRLQLVGVVRRGRVGRLGDNERVAGRVDCIRSGAGRNAGRIRLGFGIRAAELRGANQHERELHSQRRSDERTRMGSGKAVHRMGSPVTDARRASCNNATKVVQK